MDPRTYVYCSRPVYSLLLTCVLCAFVGLLTGCSTVKIDWEMATKIGTVEAYQEFLAKHPDSEFTQEAEQFLEPMMYQKITEEKTTQSYSSYLIKFPEGAHAKAARTQLKTLRCADAELQKGAFPSWLKKGDEKDPMRSSSFYLDKTFIGVSPGDIGRGYRASCDDPAYSIELAWDHKDLVYYGGRGVIVGPDGTAFLVGYDCK